MSARPWLSAGAMMASTFLGVGRGALAGRGGSCRVPPGPGRAVRRGRRVRAWVRPVACEARERRVSGGLVTVVLARWRPEPSSLSQRAAIFFRRLPSSHGVRSARHSAEPHSGPRSSCMCGGGSQRFGSPLPRSSPPRTSPHRARTRRACGRRGKGGDRGTPTTPATERGGRPLGPRPRGGWRGSHRASAGRIAPPAGARSRRADPERRRSLQRRAPRARRPRRHPHRTLGARRNRSHSRCSRLDRYLRRRVSRS